jgi:hypothetical protein
MKIRSLWAIVPVFLLFFTPLSMSAQFDGSLTRSLYFASDKADLTAESQKTLSELADSLAKFSAYALHIEGNTDADGAEEYNKKLSSARVEAARFFLINRGIPQDAFNKKDALGESKPIADNISDDGKQRNRRVDISVRYRRLPIQESIDKLLSQLENESQVFNFRAGSDTIFIADKGTIFQISAEAFDVPNGTLVNFRVRESLTMSDFLRDNLTTTSKNQILVSGGMLHLAADAGGKNVNLRKDAALVVRIPTQTASPEMEYFTGARNPHDKKMAWTSAPMSNISPLMNGGLSAPRDYSYMLEATLKEFEREAKCNCPLAEKYTYFFDSVKTLPSKDLAELKTLTRVTPSVVKPKLRFFERVRRFFGGSVEEYTPVATIKRVKDIQYEERYRIAKNVPSGCVEMAKFAVEHKMDKATWAEIHKQYKKSWYKGGPFQMWEYEPWIERAAVYNYEGLVARTKMEINFLKKIHVKRMANYERAVAARKLAFEKAVSSRIVSGTASAGDMAAYVFETKSLGYINCDRFSAYQPEQLVAMSVNLEPQKNVDVKLVFKNQKSVLSATLVNGKLGFSGIPRNEEAMIVAFKTENGQPYMAMQDVTITDTPQTLAFQPTTLALLKEKLKRLD